MIGSPLPSEPRIAFQRSMTDIIAANIRNKNKFAHTVCKEYFLMLNVAMYFPKSFYLLESIREAISHLQSAGIVEKIIEEFVNMRYWNVEQELVGLKPLSMAHLEGTFNIWMIMCFTSFMAFFSEMIYGSLKRCVIRLRAVIIV